MLATPNLTIRAASVDDLVLIPCNDNNSIKAGGVMLHSGETITSKSVVITTGTFLRAQINIGLETRPAGRLGDQPAAELGNADISFI